jgi:hypothetical protein
MKPLPLELSSSEKTCVLENKELFEKNDSCDDGAWDPNSSIRVQEKNGERILLQQSKLQFRYSTVDSLHDEMMLLDPSSSGHKNGAPSSSDKQRPPERSASAQVPTFVEGGDSNLQTFVDHPDNRDQVAVSSEIEDKIEAASGPCFESDGGVSSTPGFSCAVKPIKLSPFSDLGLVNTFSLR